VPPLLQAALQPEAEPGALARQAGLTGRKALIARLRLETGAVLIALDASRAEQLRRQVE